MSTTGDSRVKDGSRCPCAGQTLDRLLQPAALTVLSAGPLHCYRLAGRIASMVAPEVPPDAAGVYRILKVMEKRGLVASSWDVSGARPARRLYRISPAGRRCLRRWVGTLSRHRRMVEGLLRQARKAARPPR